MHPAILYLILTDILTSLIRYVSMYIGSHTPKFYFLCSTGTPLLLHLQLLSESAYCCSLTAVTHNNEHFDRLLRILWIQLFKYILQCIHFFFQTTLSTKPSWWKKTNCLCMVMGQGDVYLAGARLRCTEAGEDNQSLSLAAWEGAPAHPLRAFLHQSQ